VLQKWAADADVRPEVVTGRAGVVREASVARGIDATIAAAQTISANDAKGVDEKQDEILRLLSGATELRSLPVKSLGAAAIEALTAMMERAERGETGVGITTGFTDLDALTAGLHGGQLIVLAARPGVGKTALALAAGLAAASAGHHVVMASMEMKATELSKRALSMASGVDSQDIRMGSLSEADWEGIVAAGERLGTLPFDIVDLPNVSLSALSGLARRLKRAGKLDLLLVDYLQIMETGDSKGANRQEQIAELTRGLKKLATQLDIPIVVLSQLKRPAPGHESKPPQLTDLRESGAIEQDADVVMFIHRPDVADKTPTAISYADIIVEKQRAGPQGVVQAGFERKTTGFFDLNSSHGVVAANDPLRHVA
jgi:replicative DNA helicase